MSEHDSPADAAAHAAILHPQAAVSPAGEEGVDDALPDPSNRQEPPETHGHLEGDDGA